MTRAALALAEFVPAARQAGAAVLGFAAWAVATFVVAAALEYADGLRRKRLITRALLVDLAYRFFYRGGLYRVLVFAPVAMLAGRAFTVPRFELLTTLPPLAAAVAGFLAQDLLGYAVHRFQHSRWWWPIHSVHHSQEELSTFTGDRQHPLDFLMMDAATVLLVLIGAPTIAWLPYRLFFSAHNAVLHAQLSWTFGPVGRVLVSPVFHSVHHSTDREEHDRNFGVALTVWDHLFGTASPRRARPARTGIDEPLPDSVAAQLVLPLRRWAAQAGWRRSPGR
ncbi:MAG: sterol desaturase family protein [Gemmatimonadetes bacterium]|nr:sterol desaturase family protein [Gemmatimonadota bacterium]